MKDNLGENLIKKGIQLILSGGQSSTIVRELQELEGFNELESTHSKKIYLFLFDILKEPMVYLLLGCGVTYFFLGD